MNKTILYSGILSILSAAACAQATPTAATTDKTSAGTTPQAVVVPEAAAVVKPDTKTVVTTPGAQTPVAVATTTPPVAKPVDCTYKTPPQTTHIDSAIVTEWAEKATRQSFDFENNKIDKQLAELKACYTDQGWQSFNDALQKSGNLNAIKSQKLAVSSMVNGKSTTSEIKENQWKVSIPLQVVYQNDKEKLTQLLTVDLIIGRKITSGDLGIMQMIASPLKAENAGAKTSTTPPTTTTTTTTTTATP